MRQYQGVLRLAVETCDESSDVCIWGGSRGYSSLSVILEETKGETTLGCRKEYNLGLVTPDMFSDLGSSA